MSVHSFPRNTLGAEPLPLIVTHRFVIVAADRSEDDEPFDFETRLRFALGVDAKGIDFDEGSAFIAIERDAYTLKQAVDSAVEAVTRAGGRLEAVGRAGR